MKRKQYNYQRLSSNSKWSLISFVLSLFVFFNCSNTSEPSSTAASRSWKLICIGDENTIGAALNHQLTYPALLQQEQEKDLGFKIKIVNAGIAGETIGGVNQRIEWILQQRFDAILIAQNSKDISIEQIHEWDESLQKIRWSNPDALIMVGIISSELQYPSILSFFEPLNKKYNIKTLDFHLAPNNKKKQWWQRNNQKLSIDGHKEIARKIHLSLKMN